MPNIREDIRRQAGDSLRQGDKVRLGVLRMISAEIGKLEIEKQAPLTNDDFLQLLNRLRKMHQAAMDQFKQAGREDLYDKEAAEKAIVESLLPEQLSPEELSKIIEQGIQAAAAQTPKDLGKVMAQIKQQLFGKADMREVTRMIREKLS